jgi:hypothetical protein
MSYQHGLVEQEVSHPLADDDVDIVHRQSQILHLPADNLDDVPEAIVLHDQLGLLRDVAAVNSVHLSRTGTGSKHRQYACAAADVQNDFIFEQMLILFYRRRRRKDYCEKNACNSVCQDTNHSNDIIYMHTYTYAYIYIYVVPPTHLWHSYSSES